MPNEKKAIGRPRTDTLGINLRLSREMIHVVDARRKEEIDLPSRPEMIRRMLNKYLKFQDKNKSS